MPLSIYITDKTFGWLLEDLNYEVSDPLKKEDLMSRAVGDLEADLSRKFVVPLIDNTKTSYAQAPEFARNKILNAMKDKLREIIGYDKNRNLTGTIESTEKFLNVHGEAYKAQIKTILDSKIDFGFLLLDQAQDAQTPVQHLGIARPKDRTDPYGGGNNGTGFY